jgi:hypothetical protein
MHTNELKTGTKNDTVSSANDVRKGTMITMALTMTNPIGTVPQPDGAMKGGSRLSRMI